MDEATRKLVRCVPGIVANTVSNARKTMRPPTTSNIS